MNVATLLRNGAACLIPPRPAKKSVKESGGQSFGGAPWECLLLMVLSLFPALSGCSGLLPEVHTYGAVKPPDINRSLNGLGVHRKMWEQAGAKCLTPTRLSPKLETIDVIVLVGQSFEPPGRAARDWLERWLGRKPGRTVIYFGRDFNAEVHYLRETLSDVPIAAQPNVHWKLAIRQTSELNARLRQLPESTFCSWFFLDVDRRDRIVGQFEGPWSEAINGTPGKWHLGTMLLPPDDEEWRSRRPSWIAATKPNTSPTTKARDDESNNSVQRSAWVPEELSTPAEWQAEVARAARSEMLLATTDGEALLFRLTDSRFAGSQIVIVNNGAPFLNGSLVDPIPQAIGERIVSHCLPAERVALIAYDEFGLLISDVPEQDAAAAGLEMLTVWPLSAITMSAALIGIIMCAALLPILGRPQPLPKRSVSDFGLHVEAVGQMLQDARDVEHGKQAIREYYTRVRKEKPPAWVEEVV